MAVSSKDNLFAWACSLIREQIDKGTYGNVTVSMQNGIIGAVKVENSHKAPIDAGEKRP